MHTNRPLQQLKKILGSAARENEMLAPYTTFKIGGPADLFIEVKTTDDLVGAITSARSLGVPVFVLGGGTNILIGDKGIRGLVIKNTAQRMVIRGMKGEVLPAGRQAVKGSPVSKQVFVECDAGVMLNKLVRFTVDEGLAGLEMHLGLPGTVGGAVYMNSKWTKPEGYVGDVVYQAKIVTPQNEIRSVANDYFRFAYDFSSIQKSGDIVLSVIFSLTAGKKEALWKIANESIQYRRESQPQGIKSAGCTFKNVDGNSSGLLIDQAGLKGLKIGNAQISPKHANFISNLDHATASDVIQLIDRAKEQVKRQFGIILEEEIIRVGEF